MPDTLDRETDRFAPAALANPLFLNSIPKSGSHLLRNILRMFVPVGQQYRQDFIQWPNLQQHLAAFRPSPPMMSSGHLFFTDGSVIELAGVRKVLLYRDPYDWVLARARFFLSDEFQGNVDHIKRGAMGVDDLLTLMIFGIRQNAPSLPDMYELNVVAWLASDIFAVKYEDLVLHSKTLETPAAEAYFNGLLSACGIEMPSDWRERVRVGSDRKQSGTARENLTGIEIELPPALPDKHRQLVDYLAPGLRTLLGYA